MPRQNVQRKALPALPSCLQASTTRCAIAVSASRPKDLPYPGRSFPVTPQRSSRVYLVKCVTGGFHCCSLPSGQRSAKGKRECV